MKKTIITTLIVLLCLGIVGAVAVLGISGYVKSTAGEKIIDADAAVNLSDVDCIIILGCGVKPDGRPSDMLADRLKRGIDLYDKGAAPKIIMTGDHGRENYDEVNVMKGIAVASGIPSADVFMDHAGFSTYESMYRAREIFKAKKVIIVSQKYHLYRAVYIAEKLGMEAYGVHSDYQLYRGQSYLDFREVLARCKDFLKVIVKPEPTYLGDAIPVSGDGNLTND